MTIYTTDTLQSNELQRDDLQATTYLQDVSIDCPLTFGEPFSAKNDPAAAQSRMDIIPHPFSLPASGLSKWPPSDGQRERQDRLFFGLTGQAISCFTPVRTNFIYQRYTMRGKERQARILFAAALWSILGAKKQSWRY